MAFITKVEAFIVSEIKSTIMDRLHMGGSFLQQVPTVTVGGLPVAIKKGGALGGVGGALGKVISAVQTAGNIAALVQNPMALVQTAVDGAITGVSSKLGAITGQLTGGQLSNITTAISGITTKLNDFQAHTANLSGLASSISDTVPDFKKLQNVGENLRGMGTDTTSGFIANTASALKSGSTLSEIKDKLEITVQRKMDQILSLNANTTAGQTAISAIVTDINTLLNNQANVMNDIVTVDTHNFNEAANNLSASQDVTGLADQYNDTNSVTYSLFVDLGVAKDSTLDAFDTAIEQSSEETT
jgi:hypothetical protein